jgi:signal transduction histidine kinase/DNA-binding response OmpR family regulator
MLSSSKTPAMTILNVDDYPISREAISLILQQEGFAYIEAKTGAEALRYVSQPEAGLAIPDLVLLDVKLPDINGYEVCRRLKEDSATSAIPVLMISGVLDSVEDKTRGLNSGADGYLTKPVDTSELIATIKALLRIRRAEKEARAEVEAAKRRYWGLALGSRDIDREDAPVAQRPSSCEPIARAILSSMPAQIALLDRDGVIIAVNDAWELFSRKNTPAGAFDNQAMIGMNYLTLCETATRDRNDTAQEALTGIRSVLRREREDFTMEYPCRTTESVQWYLLRATPLPEAVGGAVVSHLNVTAQVLAAEDRARLFEREQEALARAEAVGQSQEEFLAAASHELRAPLQSILGWTKLLRGKPLSQEDAAYALEAIERSALALGNVISDMLDMSQVVTGNLRLNARTFDPVPIVEAAMDTARAVAEAKGISIGSAFDPSIREITGDPARIQQIVWNLISNAVKFTPPGGHVNIQLKRSGPHPPGAGARRHVEEIEIVVQDSGAGIHPEFLPYVFDPFRQEDGSRTRKYGDLGLGLAMVRGLAELHGGEARAESPGKNRGATFTVKLPLPGKRAYAEGALEIPATTLYPGMEFERVQKLDGVRILVVDDDPDSASLTGYMLNRWGADVRTAVSAAEALEFFERYHTWRPDILVSDIQMPGIDGYELMRKVRELESVRGKNIPAIALTAYTRAEDRIRALNAGFHIQIAKPVEPAELLAVVESFATWPA